MSGRLIADVMTNPPFLPRDLDPHPPKYFAERNVSSSQDLEQVTSRQIDHPAPRAIIEWHEEERDVQPLTLH